MLNTVLNILLVILIIAAIVLAILYFLGNKLQKRQLEQQQMLDAAAQTVSLLVIDKKKLKLTQAGLPKMVVDQTPKYMRWTKVPVVKAKIGPKIVTLIADARVFECAEVLFQLRQRKRDFSQDSVKMHNMGRKKTAGSRMGSAVFYYAHAFLHSSVPAV